MKLKRYRLLACLVALIIVAGCYFNIGGSGVRGSGIVKTEYREVAGFSSVSFKSVGRVNVQQTGKESLIISAEDNILPLLESRVKDRILYLSIANDSSFVPSKPIEFFLEVKSLESLNIDGVGSVEAKGIQGKRLAVVMDGVGKVTIAGSASGMAATAKLTAVRNMRINGSPRQRPTTKMMAQIASAPRDRYFPN